MNVFLSALIVLFSIHQAFQLCTRSGPHGFEEGKRVGHDKLIFKSHRVILARKNFTHNFTVNWPTRAYARHEIITRIEVKDMLNNGKNGCVWKKAGGVGTDFVDLLFEGQLGGPIGFYIKIYGL